jgi:hypothetical protein
MPKVTDRLLTFDEAAELLGTSPSIPQPVTAWAHRRRRIS